MLPANQQKTGRLQRNITAEIPLISLAVPKSERMFLFAFPSVHWELIFA
jgi:hypothetical protein